MRFCDICQRFIAYPCFALLYLYHMGTEISEYIASFVWVICSVARAFLMFNDFYHLFSFNEMKEMGEPIEKIQTITSLPVETIKQI